MEKKTEIEKSMLVYAGFTKGDGHYEVRTYPLEEKTDFAIAKHILKNEFKEAIVSVMLTNISEVLYTFKMTKEMAIEKVEEEIEKLKKLCIQKADWNEKFKSKSEIESEFDFVDIFSSFDDILEKIRC